MRCFVAFLFIVAILFLASCPAQAQRAIGHSDVAVAIVNPTSNCTIGDSYYNYDGSVENGYCWDGVGSGPPYYGAFAEGYDLGVGSITCGAFWLTQVGYHWGRGMDVYIWDGGVTCEPGAVLFMLPGVVPTNIPFWPDCGKNDFTISCDVTGEFTIGWWADWNEYICEWFTCVDENGPGGHPWTCICPGVGYPSGWQSPTVVFPSCVSIAIGVYFSRDASGIEEFPEEGPPAEAPTWGQIKATFEK